MLRTAVLVFGGALILGGMLLATQGIPALWMFILGALLVIGTIFERVFYKPIADARPGAGWTETGERFIDPETGKTVRVFYNAKSGERKYVGI